MKHSLRTYGLIFLVVAAIAASFGFFILNFRSESIYQHKNIGLSNEFKALFQVAEPFENTEIVKSVSFFDKFDASAELSAAKGSWILVNFWATWCPPCIAELPTLIELDNKHQDIIDVVFVSMDFPNEYSELKAKMERMTLHGSFESLYTKDIDIWEKLGLKGLPTTVLVDPAGRAQYRLAGDINWMSVPVKNFLNDLRNTKE